MDPFTEKLDKLKARYATESTMPPHVMFDLFAALHAEVHQVSLDLSVALDGVTRLDERVNKLERHDSPDVSDARGPL
jgi:hypothetical protein